MNNFLQSVLSTSTGSAISDENKAEQNGRSGVLTSDEEEEMNTDEQKRTNKAVIGNMISQGSASRTQAKYVCM